MSENLVSLNTRVAPKVKELVEELADELAEIAGGHVGLGPAVNKIVYSYFKIKDPSGGNGKKPTSAARGQRKNRRAA